MRTRVVIKRVGVAFTVVLLLACAAGCKSSSTSASAATTTAAATSHSQSPGSATSHTSSAGTSTGKTCPAGYVTGAINGVTKCLRAGEQCQRKAVSQYPAYGFDCVLNGTTYVLRKSA